MHRGSAPIAPTLLALIVIAGCTETPTLDRIGGSGTLKDSRPECSHAAPDAAPRFLPCDVEAVLRAKCQRCHNVKSVLDSCYVAKTCVKGPFPLLTWSDTHKLQDTTPTFELIHQAIEIDFMPFKTTSISPPVEPLTAAEKATLLRWTAACAPGVSKSCGGSDGGETLDAAASGDK